MPLGFFFHIADNWQVRTCSVWGGGLQNRSVFILRSFVISVQCRERCAENRLCCNFWLGRLESDRTRTFDLQPWHMPHRRGVFIFGGVFEAVVPSLSYVFNSTRLIFLLRMPFSRLHCFSRLHADRRQTRYVDRCICSLFWKCGLGSKHAQCFCARLVR